MRPIRRSSTAHGFNQVNHRLRQIGLALGVRTTSPIDPALIPNEAVRRLFQQLHPHDQRHLREVHRKAREANLPRFMCQAAILHDIGKVTLAGTTINLISRIAHVLLSQRSSPICLRPVNSRLPVVGTGMRLASGHARVGAARLRALGVPETVCHVVALHDDRTVTDPLLRLLQEIDSATP